jgi:hypothetical protein
MSLTHIAKHLETQGRGSDKHLVHMTSGELQALQKLAESRGGSLTINPKTGLPEAGFLSSLLPMVAGVVGTAMGVPLPLLMGGIGLADYAMTGSLGQGIMAGLGAWSGANLGTSVMGAASVGTDTAAKAVADMAAETAAKSSPSILGATASAAPIATDIASPLMTQSAQNLAQTAASSAGPSLEKLGSGFSKITASPGAAWNFAKDNAWPLAGALGPVAMSAAKDLMTPSQLPVLENKKNPFNLKYNSPDFKGSFPTVPTPPYEAKYPNYVTNPYNPYAAAAGGLMGVEHMAAGGRKLIEEPVGNPGIYVDPDEDTRSLGAFHAALIAHKKRAKAAGLPSTYKTMPAASPLGTMSPDPAMMAQQQIAQEATSSAKEGGLQDLGGYSDGGHLLKGPGDGVSDSIPASIGHKRPARLAEGEFVIPARIVSELGNGSTDAGAKRLYAMMDRIKAKRAKTKNIAADTKTYNLLPA